MIRSVASLVVLLAAATAALAGCSSGEPYVMDDCVPRDRDGRSVARVWDEALLDAVRRDTPAPTVHARNLFHVSAAMWDAWAAYDPQADGYLVDEKHEAEDVQAAREAAISYAAYRVLLHRYSLAAGLEETFDELAATMESLCYRVDYVTTEGDSPAALGNRIAAAVIAYGRNDGAHERLRYADPEYKPVNQPLVVAEPGAEMRDPNRWQPLALAKLIAQNGLPIPGRVQTFIGPHWGRVTGFALPASPERLPIDPGPVPRLGEAATDEEFKQTAVEVLGYSSRLDADDGATLDIGPGARGDNQLGRNDGDGHDVNSSTGEPYAPNRVRHGDFGRVLAEYWADGPSSETPPGHWNAVANEVSDSPGLALRIGETSARSTGWSGTSSSTSPSTGRSTTRRSQPGARRPTTTRCVPISMIRYLGGKGQSSDASGPAYDSDGLPLVPGLVEVVTPSSSASGGRHEALAGHVGEIAVRAWSGFPEDPTAEASGVGWIRAVDWVPYQLPTFVTPAFAGYVSGHSTFSRAAAEVLAAFTGSPYFPGGLYEVPVPAGSLRIENGPSEDVTLQWAILLRRGGCGRGLAALHGHPRLAGRLRRPQDGIGLWEGRVGARPEALRRLGAGMSRDELAGLVSDLVAIDSVNPELVPGAAGEAEIGGFVAGWLEEGGLEVEVDEVATGRPNVVGIARGSGGGRSLLLNAHMDTVGVGGMDAPLQPRVEDGRLFGRGAYDMKAGLAAIMLAAREAGRRGLRGDVLVTAVCDEEVASIGTARIAERFEADAAIVSEPTELRLALAHRGFVAFELETAGRAAHGSRPDLGIDAIAHMGPVLVRLEELDRRLRAAPTHSLLGSGSLHASLISGGQEYSSYPERCLLQGERRTIPGESVGQVERELRDLLGDLDGRARVVFAREPFEVGKEEPIVELVRRHAGDPEIVGVPFWADSALLAGAGIPTVVLGPAGEGAHAAVEWVDLASVERCVEIYTAVALELCA